MLDEFLRLPLYAQMKEDFVQTQVTKDVDVGLLSPNHVGITHNPNCF